MLAEGLVFKGMKIKRGWGEVSWDLMHASATISLYLPLHYYLQDRV